MPPDPEPLPAGGPAVTDQMLHLLHDSRDRWATGITATLHHWQDMAAVLTQVPDSMRRLWFGGYGHLLDAASERAGTMHTVFRVSFDGSGRYRIEETRPDGGSSRNFGGTIVGDGERQWWLDKDEWLAHPPGPPPQEIGKLLDPSWLLERRLTGGAETTVDDRRGYRFAVAADAPMDGFRFSADDAVADAELGILLRLISRMDSAPVARYELRDVVLGGDIRIDVPEGRPDDPKNEREWTNRLLTREVTKQARSAYRNIFGGR
jgi:outer membrane lipoprotein-sorting protein